MIQVPIPHCKVRPLTSLSPMELALQLGHRPTPSLLIVQLEGTDGVIILLSPPVSKLHRFQLSWICQSSPSSLNSVLMLLCPG